MDGLTNFVTICNFDLDEEKIIFLGYHCQLFGFPWKKVDSSDRINGNIEQFLNLI